jgi:hypothetical protein
MGFSYICAHVTDYKVSHPETGFVHSHSSENLKSHGNEC